MHEGRKRVVAIIAGILVARHFRTPEDLFGTPSGSPRSDKMITAAESSKAEYHLGHGDTGRSSIFGSQTWKCPASVGNGERVRPLR
jgi:hypothetical protein